MAKPLTVARLLSQVELAIPMRFDLSEAVEAIRSLDGRELDATDVKVASRVLTDVEEKQRELPQFRRDLDVLAESLRALSPQVEAWPVEYEPRENRCDHCGAWFSVQRSDARYCSPRCRVAAKRLRDRKAD